MTRPDMTQEILRSLVDYDPESGEFTWLKRNDPSRTGKSWDARYSGKKAGWRRSNGYIGIDVTFSDGTRRKYAAHRLAWLYVYGEWPQSELDHINRIRTDNRISNLRLADRSQQTHNLTIRSDNTSGFTGVSWNKNERKWVAYITFHGKTKTLGYFRDLDAAKEAYIAASLAQAKEFSVHAQGAA